MVGRDVDVNTHCTRTNVTSEKKHICTSKYVSSYLEMTSKPLHLYTYPWFRVCCLYVYLYGCTCIFRLPAKWALLCKNMPFLPLFVIAFLKIIAPEICRRSGLKCWMTIDGYNSMSLHSAFMVSVCKSWPYTCSRKCSKKHYLTLCLGQCPCSYHRGYAI